MSVFLYLFPTGSVRRVLFRHYRSFLRIRTFSGPLRLPYGVAVSLLIALSGPPSVPVVNLHLRRFVLLVLGYYVYSFALFLTAHFVVHEKCHLRRFILPRPSPHGPPLVALFFVFETYSVAVEVLICVYVVVRPARCVAI